MQAFRLRPQRHLLQGSISRVSQILAVSSVLISIGCEHKEEKPRMSPPEVQVSEPIQQDVPIFQEWVAQLNGPVNANRTPKVQWLSASAGLSERLLRQEGASFCSRSILGSTRLRLDQLAKAEVAVRRRRNWAEATTNVVRDTSLAAQDAIPQKQLDTDLANQAAAKAAVLAQQASLQNAELNLGWTKIYSPIDGIAGLSNATKSATLVGTSTKMTTVSQVHPIWAYFNVSESAFLGVASKVLGVISGKVGRDSMSSIPVEFIQANDVPYPHKGKFIFVNRQIGTQTGTIQMAAEFPNLIGRAAARRLRTGADSDRK